MLSANFGEAATTFRLNVDLLIAALGRVPRGMHWNLVAIKPTDEGFEFQYPINGAAASERLPATTIDRRGLTSRLVCSTRHLASLVRVLKSIRTHDQLIRVAISNTRLVAWTDHATVQFFADRTPTDWKDPSIPATNTDIPEIQLLLDRRTSDLPKGTGKWLRRLGRNALTNRDKVETTWVLSHDRVVVDIDGGIQTSVEIPCACDRWPLVDKQISLSVCPLTTAAFLECCEKGTDGCRLVYQDTLLALQSSSPRYELIAQGTLNHSIDSIRPSRTDVYTTRTAI